MIALLTLIAIIVLEKVTRKPVIATFFGWMLSLFLGVIPRRERVIGVNGFVSRVKTHPFGGDWAGTAIGSVVIVADDDHGLLRHEFVHVRQWQKWGTIPFIAILLVEYAWKLVYYRDFWKAYWNNSFEIEAYREQFGDWWSPNGK